MKFSFHRNGRLRIGALAATGVFALVAGFAVLSIPLPEPTVTGAGRTAFVWNDDPRWNALIARYEALRKENPSLMAPEIDRQSALATSLLDSLAARAFPAGDSTFVTLENTLFGLAPFVARSPERLSSYIGLMSRTRSLVKRQSEQWDLADTLTRDRLYRLLNGGRFALEQAMLQAPPDSVPAVERGDDEPSSTPAAELEGMTVHSGDVLLSRGDFSASALIARGNDYPGNFSHAALVLVDSSTHAISILESVIEEGAHVVAPAAYLADRKQRILVMRLRADLPAMRADPMLPHRAALYECREITRRHVPYDFPMDHRDHSTLYCSEVVTAAYEPFALRLWMGMSTASRPGVIAWMSSLGVRNFVLAEPGDLEYDPQLRVVAEWRTPGRLFASRLDDAVTEVMFEDADRGEPIRYPWYMLAPARLLKAWCAIGNLFGVVGKIPEGMTPSQALRADAYRALHAAIKERVSARADSISRAQHFPVHYWQLLALARRAKNECDPFGD